MNNNFYQQTTLNFPINPDLLRELNARYLHEMNIHPKNNLSLLEKNQTTKKSNKWCTAHVRICWMIYDQQQRLKEKKNNEQQLSSIHQYYSQKPTIDPFVISMIERERLLAAYSMNFDNLIQHGRFIHSQQQQQNKNLKTKFDEISSKNHQDKKRIKRTT